MSPPADLPEVSASCEVPAKPATPPPWPRLRIVFDEVSAIVLLGWPGVLTQLTQFGAPLMMMYCLGMLPDGPLLIAGAGMGYMYHNLIGYSLIMSFSLGAQSLLSQAYGAANPRRMGLLLHRLLFMHSLLILAVVVPLWRRGSFGARRRERIHGRGVQRHAKSSLTPSAAGQRTARPGAAPKLPLSHTLAAARRAIPQPSYAHPPDLPHAGCAPSPSSSPSVSLPGSLSSHRVFCVGGSPHCPS